MVDKWCNLTVRDILQLRSKADYGGKARGVGRAKAGSSLHRENRGNGPQNNPLSGKTQGILYALAVNFLILKIVDIAIFAENTFLVETKMYLQSQFCI